MTPRALHSPARLAGIPLLRTQTDERLVDLVRAGNAAAFEAIVARYRRDLLRYCSRLVPGGRAEDAVQQAFLRAYDALRASDAEMALRPWLYRIAHNVALNQLRDRGLHYEQLSESIDGVERPDQALEQKERLRHAVAAVGALPERQRDAMVLRELEGRSYEEIAGELGVTDGAVRQLLNRARGTLRAGLTAVTPFGLLARLPLEASGGSDMGVRVAELCAAGTGGALLTKACATMIVTGAVVGGVASAPSGGTDEGRASEAAREPAADMRDRGGPDAARALTGTDESEDESGERSGHGGPGSGRSRSDNSGPGSQSSGRGSDSSGSGSDSSGPGSDGSDSGDSTSGTSGSTSGSGSSGSGRSGSGSDSSGPGSGSLDSSRSGSGDSSPGSSGSGSGQDRTTDDTAEADG